MNIREIANDLRFPEGPVACRDGSIIVVEIEAGRLTRVGPSGEKTVIVETGGGPNGAAFGPDGRLFVCNNGGMRFVERSGLLLPAPTDDDDDTTGWIDAVDLDSGKVERLYTECDGAPLKAPNDIVFDTAGGFWFTDHGKLRRLSRDLGAVFHAAADGTSIKRVIAPLESPNGIGLSPDGRHLYVAETHAGRLWAFTIDAPGSIARIEGPAPWVRGRLLANPPGYCLLDSLAVDARGHVCVASIPHGLQVISADGTSSHRVEMPDLMPTNVCFDVTGRKEAYVTLSAGGRLVAMDWPSNGQELAFQH
ncbi:MAG: SMP-30/gluconolactonase/LRE family protein [Hyphomicrobiaceae bacterium]